jgi:ABC-2 type transport system ATP-binding protein
MSVSVSNLSKSYGEAKAVDTISFDVHAGEILGFLGPNGAGKTTTMRIITSYLSPTSGTVKVEGRDVQRESLEVRKLVGYLPVQNPLYLDMNVLEYLEYAAQLQGVSSAMIHQRRREMIYVCGLQEMKHKDIGQLSKGYRQRVGLAAAMIHDPRVLILDEPTSGLDPNQIVEIRSLIQNLGKEKTVILSTHILPEVQATCNRVIIINRGKIVADGPIADLQRNLHGGDRLQLEIDVVGDGDSVDILALYIKCIPAVSGVTLLADNGRTKRFSIETSQGTDIRKDIFQICVARGWNLLELHREQTSLEDIFRQLTGGTAK